MTKRKAKAETAPPACIYCHCTDDRACPGGCFWVVQGICSRCYARALDVLAAVGREILKHPAAGRR